MMWELVTPICVCGDPSEIHNEAGVGKCGIHGCPCQYFMGISMSENPEMGQETLQDSISDHSEREWC